MTVEQSGYALTCVDAWAFRDGRPGSPWGGASMDLDCVFPPPSSTVIGAIRASLARGQGWLGHEPWKASLHEHIGDGPELGRLKFTGALLRRESGLLYPVPAHLLGLIEDKHWRPATFVVPGVAIRCDLGEKVRLPAAVSLPTEGKIFKDGNGYFITSAGMSSVLQGNCPDSATIVPADDLFCFERRIGLEIEDDRGTAMEGQLYSPQFVRLKKDVELWVGVEGVPDGWKVAPMIPLGGESRLAGCHPSSATVIQPTDSIKSKIKKSRQAAMILLTPARDVVNDGHMPKPGDPVAPGLTLVSACCDRPVRLGGWNSVARCPEAQVPHLPSGSVLFVTFEDDKDIEALFHNPYIGGRNEHGLGRVVVGVWPGQNSQST